MCNVGFTVGALGASAQGGKISELRKICLAYEKIHEKFSVITEFGDLNHREIRERSKFAYEKIHEKCSVITEIGDLNHRECRERSKFTYEKIHEKFYLFIYLF